MGIMLHMYLYSVSNVCKGYHALMNNTRIHTLTLHPFLSLVALMILQTVIMWNIVIHLQLCTLNLRMRSKFSYTWYKVLHCTKYILTTVYIHVSLYLSVHCIFLYCNTVNLLFIWIGITCQARFFWRFNIYGHLLNTRIRNWNLKITETETWRSQRLMYIAVCYDFSKLLIRELSQL